MFREDVFLHLYTNARMHAHIHTRTNAHTHAHTQWQALRVFGEERGFLLGSAGYQAVAVGCHTLRQGLLLLAQMKARLIQP